MNAFLTRLWVSLYTLLTGVRVTQPALVRVSRAQRALSFLEYAMLAGIVVAVGAGILAFFPNAVRDFFQGISDSLTQFSPS